MRVGPAALCALLATMPALALWTYGAESLEVKVQPLRGRSWLLEGRDGTQVVLAKGTRSALLVDTLRTVDHAHLARAAAEQLDAVPLRHVVLTQYRPDTAGGVDDWTAAVQTIGSAKTREALARGGVRGPDLAFPVSLDLRLGGLDVNLWHKGAAHTAGATVAYLNQEQVLAVGDLVTPGRHPQILPGDGGSVRGWLQVLKQLRRDFADNEQLMVVPTRGKPGGLELITAQIDYLQDVVDVCQRGLRGGMELDELLRTVEPLRERHARRSGDGDAVIRWVFGQLGG